jgi:hypothetical protein
MLRTSDVFGIRTSVSEYSYIDRGQLDSEIRKLAEQNQHIALRGESKSGKSWLRQRVFGDGNIVACRLNYTPIDIYRQILANLGISVTTQRTTNFGGTIELQGTSEIGWKWLAKASGTISGTGEANLETVKRQIGKDEFDFDFLSKLIELSGRRVIIEDFHYLSFSVQETIAHELKSFWDFGVYFVVIGVWHRKNFVTYLNGDLAGRITEVEVAWTTEELAASIAKGAQALNVNIDSRVTKRLAEDSYWNIGILQSLALSYFEKVGISVYQDTPKDLSSLAEVDDAGMAYANQIEAIYSLFAESVSEGIRKRRDATQIYAFAMWAIMEADDQSLIKGLSLDAIFEAANARQPRIQKQNLKSVLKKFKELQVDSRGNRLILTFDESTERMIVVDKGLLIYRKYSTQKWPWEDIAIEAQRTNSGPSIEEQT